ncbi:hypothetical protein ABPG72_005715 [Tetrahymena utriculariae]
MSYFQNSKQVRDQGSQISINWSTNSFNKNKYNKVIKDLVQKNSNLKRMIINVRESYIQQEVLQALNNIIQDTKILYHFELNMASCKIENFEYIQKLMPIQNDLLSLKLIFNSVNLYDLKIKYISSCLKVYQKLKRLSINLCGCTIMDQGVNILMDDFQNFQQLEYLELDVSKNKLNSESGSSLGEGLQKLNNLSTLTINFDGNQIYNSSLLIEFLLSLKYAIQLRELNLYLTNSNQVYSSSVFDINYNILQQFFVQLSQIQSLKMLKILLNYEILNNQQNIIYFNQAIINLKKLNTLQILIQPYDGIKLDILQLLLDKLFIMPNLIYLHINQPKLYNLKHLKNILYKSKRLVKFM